VNLEAVYSAAIGTWFCLMLFYTMGSAVKLLWSTSRRIVLMSLGKLNLKSVWDSAAENLKRLSSCDAPHEFAPAKVEGEVVTRVYQCRKCEGTVDRVAHEWYLRGLLHARAEARRDGSRIRTNEPEKSVQV
jgi:hypothetical protein